MKSGPRVFRSRHCVMKGMSIELVSDSPEIGRLTGRYLFRKQSSARRNQVVAAIQCRRNGRSELYRASGPLKKSATLSNRFFLLRHIDMEARWGILTHLPAHLFPLHAAGFVNRGKTGLILGHSGAGKTTCLSDLMRRNCQALSDELNLLDLNTLHVFPYLRSLILPKHLAKGLSGRAHAKLGESSCFWPNPSGPQAPAVTRIFSLENRRTKHKTITRMNDAELVKTFVENHYVSFFLKHRIARYRKRYQTRFLRLFHAIPQISAKVKAYSLTTTPRQMFSQLIHLK